MNEFEQARKARRFLTDSRVRHREIDGTGSLVALSLGGRSSIMVYRSYSRPPGRVKRGPIAGDARHGCDPNEIRA